MNVHVFGNKKRYYIIKEDPGGTEIEQPKLLDQVRNMIRTKHYSIRTEEAYVGWIKRFILFHGKRHPKELGKKEISAFLIHLPVNRNVAASTQTRHSTRFCFYTVMSLRWSLSYWIMLKGQKNQTFASGFYKG
jgi:hypothetical protein